MTGLVLHDPATYAGGFPYDGFRALRDHRPVSHHDHPALVGQDAETVFAGPHHPYTEALLSAVPSLDGQRTERIKLEGEIPSAASPPTGCVFHTRCPRRLPTGVCETTEPPLAEVAPGHLMSCHIPIDQLRILQRAETTNVTGEHPPA